MKKQNLNGWAGRALFTATLLFMGLNCGRSVAATPATDGRRVVSYFGSFGLICHDFKGQELWRHPLPVAFSGGGFGSGTSPAVVNNLVLISRDQDENSSLLVVDIATGKTVWE